MNKPVKAWAIVNDRTGAIMPAFCSTNYHWLRGYVSKREHIIRVQITPIKRKRGMENAMKEPYE